MIQNNAILVTEDGRKFKHGTIVRHFKGKYYKVIAVNVIHTETLEPMVVYQALYDDNKIFARPQEMFISEVDHNKYPMEKTKFRLTPVTNILNQIDMKGFLKLLHEDEKAHNSRFDVMNDLVR